MKKSVKRTMIAIFLAAAMVTAAGATSVGALEAKTTNISNHSEYEQIEVVKENKEITDEKILYERAMNNISDIPVEKLPVQDSDLKVTCDNGDVYTFQSYVTAQILKETRTRSGDGEQLIAVTRVASTEQEPTSAPIQTRSDQNRTDRYENLTISSTVYYTKGISETGDNSYLITKISGNLDLKPAPLYGPLTKANFSKVICTCQTTVGPLPHPSFGQTKIYTPSGNSYSYNTGFRHPAIEGGQTYTVGCVTNASASKPGAFGNEEFSSYELMNYVIYGVNM